MVNDLSTLYQDVILDHCRHPRQFGILNDATNHAEGINPVCGDEIKVYLKLSKDKIEVIQFTGQGCAIAMASASLMSENLSGKSLERANQLVQTFLNMLTSETPLQEDHQIGKLEVFANVRQYPIRIKCATLAWHAFKAAIENKGRVTTEEP